MKKGITISILAITVTIMIILASTATVIGVSAIQTATYEEFVSKLVRVSNDVNEYAIASKELPVTMEIVAKEGLPEELLNQITKNNDEANTLHVIDMNKLRTESVNIGYGSVQNLDVFLVAKNTNNIYYLKGITFKGTKYYNLNYKSNTNKIQ